MKTGPAGGVAAFALFAMCGWNTVHGAEAKTDPQVAREYLEQAVLDVDTGGKVTAVQLPEDVPAMLVEPAREAVGRWRFKPPVHDGHAVTARTYVRLLVQVVRQPNGNFGLRAVYRSNGPGLAFTPPEYPINEARRRGQGTLVMEATAQPDGTLAGIHVASYRFNHPNPGAFIKSAEAVLQHAHAQPELVDGKPVATRIQVPFVYALQSLTRSEALARQAGKKAAPAAARDFSPIGDPTALDSPVQPLVDPPGR